MTPVTENEFAEIFARLKALETIDAKQNTEIEVIKTVLEIDIKHIRDSLASLAGGKSEACLGHTREIEALKLAQKQLEEMVKSKASASSLSALWFVVGGLGSAILVAVVKSLLGV